MKSVFISSTFKDMQAERDYLHEKIFPRLRRVIGEYGEDIQELDLRWGVDTMEMSEEESGHQVLRVCIDAIDRCRPFIIVLLGERYGWIPETSLVESLHDERVDRWYEKEMSITNLEIRYGALSEDETLRRCVFCFRNPDVISRIDETHRPLYDAESPLHREKLDALKAQIRAKKDVVILEYDAGWDSGTHSITGLDAFGEQLYLILEKMIREEFAGQTARNPMEQMKRNMARMKEQYLSTYVPRQQEEAELLTRLATYHEHFIGIRLKSVENSLFVYSRIYLFGEAGSGKSAIMAAMARHLEEAGRDTILYFAGGQGCRKVSILKDFMIFRLEEILDIPHETDYVSRDSRLSALSEKAADRDIYCLIDGLDQLYPDYDRIFFDILGLCPNLCYLMSALPDFPVLKVTDRLPDYYMVTEDEESRNARYLRELIIPMHTLSGTQRREIIQKTSAKRGKKLSPGIVELILQKTGTDNPLYLTMLLQRLFMMDQQEFEAAEALSPGMEGLYQYMGSLMDEMPDTPEDMAVYLLDTTGRRFASDTFRTTLMLLAVSDYGLTERELEGLFETAKISFSLIQFQQIVSYLYDAFSVSEDGKWMFGHRLFREAVLCRMTEKDTAFVNEMLLTRSEQDDHFLETEGYVYVLKAKHSAGSRVIEKAKGWTTFQEVRDFIGKFVEEDSEYSCYFKEITDQAQPDLAAEFWLGFNYYDYGKELEKFWGEICESLSRQKELSFLLKCRCLAALGGWYIDSKNDTSSCYQCLDMAEQLCEQLSEPEKSIQIARICATKAHYREALYLEENWKLATADMQKAFEVLAPHRCQGTEEERMDVLKRDIRNRLEFSFLAQRWRSVPCTELLEACQEELNEYVSLCHTEADQMEQKSLQCEILAYLSKGWQFKGHYDLEKAKQYAKDALACSEALIQEAPTTDNLWFHIYVLDFYATGHYKSGGRYPYMEKQLQAARRIYAGHPSLEWKRQLAWTTAYYAYYADTAIERRVSLAPDDPSALLKKAEKAWKEAFRLYEELLEEGEHMDSYPNNLSYKAEFDQKRGYLKNALRYALRGLEIIEKGHVSEDYARRNIRHIFTLNQAAAFSCYEMGRPQEALPYARKAAKLARGEYDQKGKMVYWIANSQLVLAKVLYLLRHDEEALSSCNLAQEYFEKMEKPDMESVRSGFADIAYIRGRLALEKGDIAAAGEYEGKYAILIDGLPDQSDGQIESKWRRGKLLMLQADVWMALCGKEKAAKLYYEAIEIWHKAGNFYSGSRLNPCCLTYSVEEVKGRLQREKCYVDTGRQDRANYYERYCLFHYAEASGDWEYVEKTHQPDVEHGYKWTSWILSPYINTSFARLDARFQSELQNISWWRTAPAKRVEWEPEPLQVAAPEQFLDKLEYYLSLDGKDRLNYALMFVSKNEPGILSWEIDGAYAECFEKLTETLYAEVMRVIWDDAKIRTVVYSIASVWHLSKEKMDQVLVVSGAGRDILWSKEDIMTKVWRPVVLFCMLADRGGSKLSNKFLESMLSTESELLSYDKQKREGDWWIGKKDEEEKARTDRWRLAEQSDAVLDYLFSVMPLVPQKEDLWDLMNIVAVERYRRRGDKAVIWEQLEHIRETAKKRMEVDAKEAYNLHYGSKKDRPPFDKAEFIRDGNWKIMAECVWKLYQRLIRLDGAYWFQEYFSFMDENPLMFKALTGHTQKTIKKELEPYYNLMMKDGTLLGEKLDALFLEEIEFEIQKRKKDLAKKDWATHRNG